MKSQKSSKQRTEYSSAFVFTHRRERKPENVVGKELGFPLEYSLTVRILSSLTFSLLTLHLLSLTLANSRCYIAILRTVTQYSFQCFVIADNRQN